MTSRSGEYADRGDYHRQLDPRWPYYPIFQEKQRFVRRYLDQFPKTHRILDAGCGEGLLVEEYRQRGYDISGLDLNYESEHVQRGSLLDLPYADASWDVVLALDVLEHLPLLEQPVALHEIARVLRPGGSFCLAVPNLAHFSSRLAFLFTGKFLRTSQIERHPGDRPYAEYRRLLQQEFEIERVRGLFPTFPISALLTLARPAAMWPWHRVLNATVAWPSWCFLTVFFCRKRRIGP